jgi:hypothetical protein
MKSQSFGVRYNSNDDECCKLLESVLAFCQLGLALLVVLFLIAAINWQRITSFMMEKDLRHYAQSVRVAEIELADKERLLDLIEGLEDRISDDDFCYWKWYHHNHVIRSLLQKGITSDEARLIERELKRITEGK